MLDVCFDSTYRLMAVGCIVATALHGGAFWLLVRLRKRIPNTTGWCCGLAVSLVGTNSYLVYWFIASEWTGPIGRGLAIMLAPVAALIASVVFTLIGWSLHGTLSEGAALLRKKSGARPIRLGIRALVLCICVGYVQSCVRSTRPVDDGLAAEPTMNLTNGVGMLMVRTAEGYWVATHETTEAQFAQVMGWSAPDRPDPKMPILSITFERALLFCQKLTERERANGRLPEGYAYTLPTWKQWRAYVADAQLDDAVLRRNVQTVQEGSHRMMRLPPGHKGWDVPNEVGSRGPNRLGLYDVRGNVAEWSIDWYEQTRGWRVVLGSSFGSSSPERWLLDNREGLAGARSSNVGFRVILVSAPDAPGAAGVGP